MMPSLGISDATLAYVGGVSDEDVLHDSSVNANHGSYVGTPTPSRRGGVITNDTGSYAQSPSVSLNAGFSFFMQFYSNNPSWSFPYGFRVSGIVLTHSQLVVLGTSGFNYALSFPSNLPLQQL